MGKHWTLSKETRAKMSKAQKERVRKPFSEKAKQKMSDTRKRLLASGEIKMPKGKDHPSWKGGTRKSRGRTMIYAPDNPMADVYGYVYDYRLRAAKALGRPLTSDEVVHHVNDEADTLIVCSREYHAWLHAQLDKQGG